MTRSSMPAVSVVVCTFNGARTIRACLEALERQSVRSQAEVIVVDDGSRDGTVDIARVYPVIVLSHPTNRGLSAARNTGTARAAAPIVAFTDDDCAPDQGWLAGLLAAYSRPDVVGVGGPVDVASVRTFVQHYLADNPPIGPLELELASHPTLPQRFALYIRSMWAPREASGERAVYSLAGANMSFRKEALVAVGGFDPAITFGSDDEYICRRAREHFPDRKLWFTRDALVHHDYRGTLGDVARRHFAYGRGHARMYINDPSQRWPILFPLPLLALIVFAALRGRRRLIAALLVQIAYPQGLNSVVHHRKLAYLSFSWLRLLEESAHNLGMLTGLLGAAQRCTTRPGTDGSGGPADVSATSQPGRPQVWPLKGV